MHNPYRADASQCFPRGPDCQVGKAVAVEVSRRERPAEQIVPLSRFLHPGAVLMEYLTALCR